MIFSNTRILDMIKKYFLANSTITLLLTLFGFLLVFIGKPDLSFGSLPYILLMPLRSLCSFLWIISLLGIGMRLLNFNNKILKYCNEAVLPFYILHHVIIVVIGYYIVKLELGIGLKFVIIGVLSLIAIMAIYEFLVRRFNLLRFLFGMKLLKQQK